MGTARRLSALPLMRPAMARRLSTLTRPAVTRSVSVLAALALAAALPAAALAQVPGVTADTIKIGSFGPLTGPNYLFGKLVMNGVQNVYNEVNKQGGINGRKLVLVREDDRCDPATAIAAVKKLIHQDQVFMINGGGYPTFRYPRDCHAASKLVHVCDVYDALRTKRPYRDAWPAEQVLSYLEGRAGQEFDGELVNSFARMMRQWEPQVAVLADENATVPAPPGAAPAVAPVPDTGTPSSDVITAPRPAIKVGDLPPPPG